MLSALVSQSLSILSSAYLVAFFLFFFSPVLLLSRFIFASFHAEGKHEHVPVLSQKDFLFWL